MPVLVAMVCFFLSGVAGLIYEVCWIRKASLIFGSTTYALSTVLAVFFIGLALGSWFFGRLSPRLKRPLRIYAILEIGAAVFALASPWLFAQVNELYGHVYRTYSGDLGPLFFVRFALVALVLLPPTFLLGGTFPLFARQFVVSKTRISTPVGLLYAVNTSGAALGCALAGFRLIPTIGVQGTLWVGAALSFVAGVVVAALRLPAPVDPANEPRSKESARQTLLVFESRDDARVMISVLFFATGFVALASQILWARYLALLVRTTVLTYTLTLTVVLVGIVLGSALAAPLFDRAMRWRSLAFGGLQVLTGLCLLAVMLLPPATWKSFDQGLAAYFILLLPPAILSGASFPLAVRMVVNDPAFAGAGVGKMTAINTLGGVSGSLAFGFWGLPELGLQPSLVLASGVAVASGIAAWWFLRGGRRTLVAALSMGAIAIWLALPRILPTRIPGDFLGERGSVVDFKEGLAANVAVVQAEESLRLEIDRWWQGDERKGHQIMAAHIPMILHAAPHDVLVVGAGVGQTARRFLMYEIGHLDCVDLEPAVFEIVREHFESSWVDDPRTRLIREDGRNYLSHTEQRYDVISLEAGQIFRPGVAAFYTADFYSRAAQKLNPGGLLAQFVPLPFLTEEQFRGIVRTFRETFPEAVLWYNTSELLLLGSRDVPIEIQHARLTMLETPPLSEDLQYSYWDGPAYWLRRPEVFLAGFLLGPRGLAALASKAPVYRDDVPILEYATVDAVESEMRELPTVEMLRRHLDPIATVIEAGGPAGLTAQAERIRQANVGDLVAAAHIRSVGALRQRGDLPGMRRALAEALKHNSSNLEAQRLMGDVHVQLGRAGDAVAHYMEALRIDESDALSHRGLAIALHLTGRPQDAIPHYRAAFHARPSDFEIMNGLGGALAQTGALEEAAGVLEEALRLQPDFAQAKKNLERVRQAMAQGVGK
jgi:spermidine synthase